MVFQGSKEVEIPAFCTTDTNKAVYTALFMSLQMQSTPSAVHAGGKLARTLAAIHGWAYIAKRWLSAEPKSGLEEASPFEKELKSAEEAAHAFISSATDFEAVVDKACIAQGEVPAGVNDDGWNSQGAIVWKNVVNTLGEENGQLFAPPSRNFDKDVAELKTAMQALLSKGGEFSVFSVPGLMVKMTAEFAINIAEDWVAQKKKLVAAVAAVDTRAVGAPLSMHPLIGYDTAGKAVAAALVRFVDAVTTFTGVFVGSLRHSDAATELEGPLPLLMLVCQHLAGSVQSMDHVDPADSDKHGNVSHPFWSKKPLTPGTGASAGAGADTSVAEVSVKGPAAPPKKVAAASKVGKPLQLQTEANWDRTGLLVEFLTEPSRVTELASVLAKGPLGPYLDPLLCPNAQKSLEVGDDPSMDTYACTLAAWNAASASTKDAQVFDFSTATKDAKVDYLLSIIARALYTVMYDEAMDTVSKDGRFTVKSVAVGTTAGASDSNVMGQAFQDLVNQLRKQEGRRHEGLHGAMNIVPFNKQKAAVKVPKISEDKKFIANHRTDSERALLVVMSCIISKVFEDSMSESAPIKALSNAAREQYVCYLKQGPAKKPVPTFSVARNEVGKPSIEKALETFMVHLWTAFQKARVDNMAPRGHCGTFPVEDAGSGSDSDSDSGEGVEPEVGSDNEENDSDDEAPVLKSKSKSKSKSKAKAKAKVKSNPKKKMRKSRGSDDSDDSDDSD